MAMTLRHVRRGRTEGRGKKEAQQVQQPGGQRLKKKIEKEKSFQHRQYIWPVVGSLFVCLFVCFVVFLD